MEDARWRYLADAYAVLNCDIDELALSAQGNIFDQAAASAAGYVKFSGRWVTPRSSDEAEMIPRHQESTQQTATAVALAGLSSQGYQVMSRKVGGGAQPLPGECPLERSRNRRHACPGDEV